MKPIIIRARSLSTVQWSITTKDIISRLRRRYTLRSTDNSRSRQAVIVVNQDLDPAIDIRLVLLGVNKVDAFWRFHQVGVELCWYRRGVGYKGPIPVKLENMTMA